MLIIIVIMVMPATASDLSLCEFSKEHEGTNRATKEENLSVSKSDIDLKITQYVKRKLLRNHYNVGQLRRAAFTKRNNGHKLKLTAERWVREMTAICRRMKITSNLHAT